MITGRARDVAVFLIGLSCGLCYVFMLRSVNQDLRASAGTPLILATTGKLRDPNSFGMTLSMPVLNDDPEPALPAKWKDHRFKLFGKSIIMRDLAKGSKHMQYLAREFQKDHYKLKTLNLTDDAVVIDIGANIGWFSVLCGLLNPTARIYAFEPAPHNYAFLRWNLKVNHVSNVVAVNMGLSKDRRNLTLKYFEEHSGSTSAYAPNLSKKRHSSPSHLVSVRTVTLDDIIANYVPNNCELLKLDCEGCEYDFANQDFNKIKRVYGELHGNRFQRSAAGSKISRCLWKSFLQLNKPTKLIYCE